MKDNPFIKATQKLIAENKSEEAINNLMTYTSYLKNPKLHHRMIVLQERYNKWKNRRNLLDFGFSLSFKNRLDADLLKVTTALGDIDESEKHALELKLDMSEKELDANSQKRLVYFLQRILGLPATLQFERVESR
jgi:hypothetical protein